MPALALTPVDHDPFAPQIALTPVDHDPFSDGSGIGLEPGSIAQDNGIAPPAYTGNRNVPLPSGGPDWQSLPPFERGIAAAVATPPMMAWNALKGADKTVAGALSILGGQTPYWDPSTGHTSDEAINTGANLGLLMTGAGMASPAMEDAAGMGIRAYHGSPHDFDQFKWDQTTRGTGEGAQAYGDGLYFAGNPATAQAYKEQLAGLPKTDAGDLFSQLPWSSRNTEKLARDAMTKAIQSGKVGDEAVRDAVANLSKQGNEQSASHVRQPYYDASNALGSLIGKKWDINPGRMYEVDINADPSQFLDWDKPLSAQADDVRAKAAQAGFAGAKNDADFSKGLKRLDKYMNSDDYAYDWRTSEDFRRDMTKFLDVWDKGGDPAAVQWMKDNPFSTVVRQAIPDRSASFVDQIAKNPENVAKLREAGIPGIKYLDQGSRGNANINDLRGTVSMWETAARKSPNDTYAADMLAKARQDLADAEKPATSNYVVFDDKLVSILKKYGIPITGGSAAMMQQFMGSGKAEAAPNLKLTPVDHDPFE